MLKESDGAGMEILSGELVAQAGGKRYPIIDGIPRFVPENFYSSDGSVGNVTDPLVCQTVHFYEDFWKAESNNMLGRTDVERKEYEPRFHALLGVDSEQSLRYLFQDGMNCLNAGCGIAWSEYLFNINANVNRFCVDLSGSVKNAYENTRGLDNVFVAQADLFNLPFSKSYFDIIFSSGVLHHTRDPRKAFETLCSHLKPGGLIGIYVYSIKPFIRELSDYEIRKRTSRMAAADLRKFCAQMAMLGRALQRFKEPLLIEAGCELIGITRGTYDLQKFVYDHFLKCFYNDRLGLDYSVWANIDWYGPEIQSHHTREELSSWFEENHVSKVRFTELEGWEHSGFFVSGRKLADFSGLENIVNL